jgi:CRISPR-associated endonuclease/helicase Cas3
VDLRELALHLIASHHGRARPNINAFEPLRPGDYEPFSVTRARAEDAAVRFARLQRRWGPWGLAWWEAVFRAADRQASADHDARDDAEDKSASVMEDV